MPSIDLNIDLGELPGEPEELFAIAGTANIACGGHAGDERSMERAVELARAHGAQIAAHPSYPDRDRFGRVSMPLAPEAVATAVESQCAALAAIGHRLGVTVTRMKPHGALYHDAARDRALAAAVIEAAARGLGVAVTALVVVGPPAGALRDEAAARGAPYAREGFADRAYRPDGTLVPRAEAGALITDPEAAAAQAIALAARGDLDTLCVHGDTEGAVSIARRVREALATRA